MNINDVVFIFVECKEKATFFFPTFKEKINNLELKYDLRGVNAGLAYLNEDFIRININIKIKKDYIDIIMHEIAHFISYWYGEKGNHSNFWQQIAVRLGSSPSKYHNIDLKPCHRHDTLYCSKCKRKYYAVLRVSKNIDKNPFICYECKKRMKSKGQILKVDKL